MEQCKEGTIIRALSGFYDVDTGKQVVRCRARGKFRKEKITPLVGDRVLFQESGDQGYVTELLPRKNHFIRPAVANVDARVMLAAQVNPVTEPFLIDRVAAIAAVQGVELILVLNKCDLDPAEELYGIYQDTGMQVFRISATTGEGVAALRQQISAHGLHRELRCGQIQPVKLPVPGGQYGCGRCEPEAGPGPAYHPAYRAVFPAGRDPDHGHPRLFRF